VQGVLDVAGLSAWDVGVLLTDNANIQRLNRLYRNRNAPTDILSFPFHVIQPPGKVAAVVEKERDLGDMVLSAEYIKHYCRANRVSYAKHLQVCYVHGICHLLGYDHELQSDYQKVTVWPCRYDDVDAASRARHPTALGAVAGGQ